MKTTPVDVTHEKFEKGLAETLQRHFGRQTPDPLAESVRYSVLNPGKRIRPRLLLAAAQLLDLPEASALPSAYALEFVHCFTLIHDDLPCMDNDDFRRGLPTNHKKFGEGLALLAGDALIAIANTTILETSAPTDRVLAAIRRLNFAMGPQGVCGGQAAESGLTPHSTLKELSHMHAAKTGALFEAALLIPADLAQLDLNSPRGKALSHFAAELGSAFQIADDLEDAIQDEKLRETATPPTSILHYMTASEARQKTHDKLSRACRELRAQFGESAEALDRIAHEVLNKLLSS